MGDDADRNETYRTAFDVADDQPNVDVTETVAELKGVDSDQLSPLYTQIDHILDNLFSEPPRPEANVAIAFTYEGYRIAVQQNGRAEFRQID